METVKIKYSMTMCKTETISTGHIPAAEIKKSALRVGFSFCGVAAASEVDADEQQRYLRWLHNGNHDEMHYLENHIEKRFHPERLVEGCRTIVSVALNYYPPQQIPEEEYQLAWYAYGTDYHLLVKEKLQQMVEELRPWLGDTAPQVRVFCDTAPVLERYWAWKAGLGWRGKNDQLIIPGAGSTYFLGELFLPLTSEYDTPLPDRCGNCRRCVESCPAHAINEDRTVDARRCLSCQTIEHRGPLAESVKGALGNRIYGCDVCQRVCPYLRFAVPTPEVRFHARPELLAMKCADWQSLTPEEYRELFRKSAVKRAKYEGLMRNIEAVSGKK
jgi:epoxyqueuosine reductase